MGASGEVDALGKWCVGSHIFDRTSGTFGVRSLHAFKSIEQKSVYNTRLDHEDLLGRKPCLPIARLIFIRP